MYDFFVVENITNNHPYQEKNYNYFSASVKWTKNIPNYKAEYDNNRMNS